MPRARSVRRPRGAVNGGAGLNSPRSTEHAAGSAASSDDEAAALPPVQSAKPSEKTSRKPRKKLVKASRTTLATYHDLIDCDTHGWMAYNPFVLRG